MNVNPESYIARSESVMAFSRFRNLISSEYGIEMTLEDKPST